MGAAPSRRVGVGSPPSEAEVRRRQTLVVYRIPVFVFMVIYLRSGLTFFDFSLTTGQEHFLLGTFDGIIKMTISCKKVRMISGTQTSVHQRNEQFLQEGTETGVERSVVRRRQKNVTDRNEYIYIVEQRWTERWVCFGLGQPSACCQLSMALSDKKCRCVVTMTNSHFQFRDVLQRRSPGLFDF